MGLESGDGVDRAFALVEADGRRKLSPEEESSGKALWRRLFRDVSTTALVSAAERWVQEYKRGRPSVAEIRAILDRAKATPTRAEILNSRQEEQKRLELTWAISILEYPSRWEGMYQHSLVYAEKCLRHWGLAHWHDAKAYLEPGWAPVQVTEVYL